METLNEYDTQAEKFLEETKTQLIIQFLKWDYYFEEDTDKRDIYSVTMIRGDRRFTFNFGQSIVHSGEYILFPSQERVHLKKSTYGSHQSIKQIKGFGMLNNGNSKKNKDFKIPSAYDILACLQKYDVGSFETFCADFGYETDSRKAERVYKAVLNEWNNVKMLYSDSEIEMLGEIQ